LLPKIIGILNLAEDSFFDGGRYNSFSLVLDQAYRMIDSGAEVIDIGAESTRPGSKMISSKIELDKIIPLLSELKKTRKILISIDTYKYEVAEQALEHGADIINDIYALRFHEKMGQVLSRFPQSKIILTHMQGNPTIMQMQPLYHDVIQEISDFFHERIDYCLHEGIDKSRLILDPGIGFGKCFEHNIMIIKNIEKFHISQLPICLGASRKSFLNEIYPSEPSGRLMGSLATTVVAYLKKLEWIRVHDVQEHHELLKTLSVLVN